jgi:hypothetical protein
MSDPKTVEPDQDLLEFLGGIDEFSGDSKEGGFADFLAKEEVGKTGDKPKPPVKDEK